MANSTEETNETLLEKHQAWAWAYLVTTLIVDHGLSHTEPGDNMLQQVINFLDRKLKK